MKLPFTVEQFLQVFKNYNNAIFPMQIVFYLLALTIIFLSIKKSKGTDKIINSIIAFFWLWMGIIYHMIFFTTINKAAYLFGGFFIIQAMLFFYYGVIKQRLSYSFTQNIFGILGLLLIIFALVVYPLLGYVYGHMYPLAPTFGAPCPTTIFTFGVFLLSETKLVKIVLIIPFLWSLLGFSAATNLGIKEDTALLIAGFLTTAILLFRKPNVQTVQS
ncbi:MAG TPA: DUF6064 family protein [Flavisolibacter sp.]|jgi:hypothetical protein|nr:DUF6064 family protein [Flavisolibacter sp.]